VQKTPLLALIALAAALAAPAPARAVEYRTVEAPAVLYDTPSQKGVKLYVIRPNTPVEIVVSLEGWNKVRDADGALAWIEQKYLGRRRTVIVKSDWAAIRQKPDPAAPIVFEAERQVTLDYQETLPGGWVKVRHRDGQEGYAHGSQVWGF
jgi:SH3-like domain-containing protein